VKTVLLVVGKSSHELRTEKLSAPSVAEFCFTFRAFLWLKKSVLFILSLSKEYG